VQSNTNPCTQTNYSTGTVNLPSGGAITYLTPNTSVSLRGNNLWNGTTHAITVTGLYLLTADWRYVNSTTDSTFNYTLWATLFYNQTTSTEVIRQYGTKMHVVVQLTAGNNYVFGIQNSTTTAQTLRTVNTLNTFQVVLLALKKYKYKYMKLKNGNVLMPKAKFIQEHKRLTKILSAVARENQKQMKELREFRKRKN
jgi:hypothetical protein